MAAGPPGSFKLHPRRASSVIVLIVNKSVVNFVAAGLTVDSVVSMVCANPLIS